MISQLLGLSTSGPAPAMIVVLSAAVALVARRAGPRPIRALEAARGVAYRRLHPLDGPVGRMIPPRGDPRSLTRQKDDDEYVLTARSSVMRLYRVLLREGATWNPKSTKKYRMIERRGETRKQYSVGSFVFRDNLLAQRQLHIYLFPSPDGGVDVNAHEEDSTIADPEGHVDAGDMVKGDPDGKIERVLEDAGIKTETREQQ
jgi:hypothetical protein